MNEQYVQQQVQAQLLPGEHVVGTAAAKEMPHPLILALSGIFIFLRWIFIKKVAVAATSHRLFVFGGGPPRIIDYATITNATKLDGFGAWRMTLTTPGGVHRIEVQKKDKRFPTMQEQFHGQFYSWFQAQLPAARQRGPVQRAAPLPQG